MSKIDELRYAFDKGARWAARENIRLYPMTDRQEMIDVAAEAYYPTPMKTVAREVVIQGRTYFVDNGEVRFRTTVGADSYSSSSSDFNVRTPAELVSLGYSVDDIVAVLDLITNPMEEVPA